MENTDKQITIEDGQVKVVTTIASTSEKLYSMEYLVSQRASIQAQKDRDNEQRDKELAEIDEYISQAEKAGL